MTASSRGNSQGGKNVQTKQVKQEHVALRKELVAALAAFDDANAELRQELRAVLAVTRRYRRQIEMGGRASDLNRFGDVAGQRRQVSTALAGFEQARQRTHRAIFRLATEEGESLTSLARAWGISRQLVSRILHGSP